MTVLPPNPVVTYCDPTDVMAVLRLSPGDIDASRVDEATNTAAAAIRFFVWGYSPAIWPLPADQGWLIRQANITVAVEEYRRPGIAFGLLDQWTDVGPVRVGSDPLAGVYATLMPLKADWGIG